MFNKSISYIVFLSAFIFVFLFFPIVSRAASVGFLPSTPLWYSPEKFALGEIIRLYTVVINNDYPSLNGVVAFYANGDEIDRSSIVNLKQDKAEELKVYWQPTSGDYTLSAKFVSANAVDEHGATIQLNPNDISTAQTAFNAGKNNLSTTTVNQNPDPTPGVATVITIKKQGNEFLISPKASADANSVIDSIANTKEKIDSVLHFVTSSANTIAGTVEKTKSAVETGQKYYAKGEAVWQKITPYLSPLKRLAALVTNNYDRRRILYIIGGAVIFIFALKIIRRQRTFDDYR
jgi:predicted DNA binding protein